MPLPLKAEDAAGPNAEMVFSARFAIIALSHRKLGSSYIVRDLVAENTQRLLVRAKDGDRSALNLLCSTYAERVRRIARLRMGAELRSQLESMDIVQDALCAAAKDVHSFTYRREGDFLRWLVELVENRIRDHADRIHAQKRDVRRQVSLDPVETRSGNKCQMPGGLPLVTTTPSVILAHTEELDRLERAMDQLKGEYRQVILLAKIEGLSYQKIGQRITRSPDAVGMLLSRAMVALAKAFERL